LSIACSIADNVIQNRSTIKIAVKLSLRNNPLKLEVVLSFKLYVAWSKIQAFWVKTITRWRKYIKKYSANNLLPIIR